MTTKSGSTRIPTAKFFAIATKLGLQASVKAGWVLFYNPENPKARLLAHTGKRGTNCVELVGFESPHAIAHPCSPAKTMTQMLDCNVPEKEVLRAFYKTAKLLTACAVMPAAPTAAEIQNDSPAVTASSETVTAPAEVTAVG